MSAHISATAAKRRNAAGQFATTLFLTPRRIELMVDCILRDMPIRAIGDRLNVSKNTAWKWRKSVDAMLTDGQLRLVKVSA